MTLGSDLGKSARQKFEDRKLAWTRGIAGADQIEIQLWSAGDLLERLSGHPNHRGLEWFFWNEEVFSLDWLQRRHDVIVDAVGQRYSPQLHVELLSPSRWTGWADPRVIGNGLADCTKHVLTAARPIELIGFLRACHFVCAPSASGTSGWVVKWDTRGLRPHRALGSRSAHPTD